jgi:hypothetical protein
MSKTEEQKGRLRRHSSKDQQANISPEGMGLAIEEGNLDKDTEFIFFHELPRTAQTAAAYAGAMDHPVRVMPMMPGMGNADLFGEMITDEWKALAPKLGNFPALLKVHGVDKCKNWATVLLRTVTTMFDACNDNFSSFSHSPCIELVIWLLLGCPELGDMPKEFQQLGDLEGVELILSDCTLNVGVRITIE